MRRLLIISTRICNGIILGHPFLVAMAGFCVFLHLYFPYLFSILISASPVLVCTAILLGTLLMFGEANVAEIERENVEDEETKVSPSFEDATAFVGERKDGPKKAVGEEKNLLDDNADKILNDKGSHDRVLRKRVIEKVQRGFDDLEKKRKMQEEILGIKEVLIGNHYSMIQHMEKENLEVKNNKLIDEFAEDKERPYLGFPKESSWKRLDDDDEEGDSSDEEDEEDGSDSELESSSNASLENILPLDELHPLLDEETPRPTHISHSGSGASSKNSHSSNESSIWPDNDMMKLTDGVQSDEEENEKEKQRHVEDEDEGFDNESNDNDEEEEEVQGGKEDESKSAIKWTEDDQKNVMDLGTLEIERNQRLENLIAKRIAHRNLSMITERNLIDFDGADLPNNIPSISTRRNPFDYDDDSPGSAPSMFLPKRNPFELPYGSIEQRSHLKESSFQQEFVPSQHREPFFRRHQSFNVGPSFLGVGNIDRQDFRWKPYFSPDRSGTEGTSNETFQKQLSEASDSKMSSTQETESVSSTVEEKKFGEEDTSQETEIISNMQHGSLLVEHGSLSSEDVESLDIDQKVEELNDENGVVSNLNNRKLTSRLSASEEITTPIELNVNEILLRMEADEEEEDVSRSTLSSSSEREETIFDINKSFLQKKYGQNDEEFSHVNHIAEHSSTTQFEQDHAWLSSTADTKINQDINGNVISSDQHFSTDATSKKHLKNQQTWSNKTVLRTSFHDHDQPEELNKTHEWSAEETSNAKNVDMPETFGTQNNMSEIITLSTPGSSSASPIRLEDKSFFGDNYYEEAYKSLARESNVRDEGDDIKAFDDGLFSGLSTTGDLIVKEVACETQDEQAPESRIGSPKFDSLPNDPGLTEIREELIALVVSSHEDEYLNSKQFDEADNGQESTESKMMRESQVLEERYSNVKVTEASSLQDIDNPAKQISRGNKTELPQPPNSKDVADPQNIESSSLDDIGFNTKEVSQTNGEEELDWFDTSDSLEERNETDMDSTRE